MKHAKQILGRAMIPLLLLTFAIVVGTPKEASAISPFARKYATSCTTCHVAPPKLNAFGRAFKNLGYRMPEGDEDLVKQKPTSMGAPGWKRVWPKGVWPSDIPGGTFLGMILESNFTYNSDATVKSEFDGIEEIGLLLGGTAGESFSFFGDVDLFEGGKPGHIGRLFVQYNNPKRLFNVKLGMFEPRAAPVSNHMRLIRKTNHLTNLFPTIPAGNFYGFSPNQRGIELWGGREGPGGKGGLLWAVGVVNGEPGGALHVFEEVEALEPLIEELEEHYEEFGGEFDVNSGKDVYVQGSYKLGGLGIFGSGADQTLKQTQNWRDDSVTLGGYYYRGTTGAFVDLGLGEEYFNDANTFYRSGVTVDAWFRDLNIIGGYQLNSDRLEDGRRFNVGITTLEADYVLPWPWIQPAIRFEAVNPDFTTGFHRTTLSTTFLLRANVLMTVEGALSRKAPALPPFDDSLGVGLRILF